jgi:hypothetical protein
MPAWITPPSLPIKNRRKVLGLMSVIALLLGIVGAYIAFGR